MRILIGHNHYQWAGGEDAVFETESRLLKDFGHEVYALEANNNFISSPTLGLVFQAKNLFWSKISYLRLRDAIRFFKPDIAHFHNIYFSLTPSVYDACQDEGVPVVQSLHNFRMLCANGLFFRDGNICEDCLKKSPLEGIIRRCYKNSVVASGGVTALTSYHRWRKTWMTKVDRYITATEFTRNKYIQAGLAADKIAVKPNVFFHPKNFTKTDENFVLYVGRLSNEKGIEGLLQAWERLPNIPLKIIGDGPLREKIKFFTSRKEYSHIEFLSACGETAYQPFMQKAKFLVIPSQCYENFPRVAVEAFAFGLPILANRLGSLIEIVEEGVTGFLCDPFDATDLAAKACQMWNMDLSQMSAQAREAFEKHYSPEINVRQLVSIYEQARS